LLKLGRRFGIAFHVREEWSMSSRVMVLPCSDPKKIRLVQIPRDMDSHEAFRHATGLIAEAEESNAECGWEEIEDALEAHGFETLEFILGPALD
jgi:hypothetical protein